MLAKKETCPNCAPGTCVFCENDDLRSDRDFYRRGLIAARDCATRWLANAENLGNMRSRSRRDVLRDCAREILDAIGAVNAG